MKQDQELAQIETAGRDWLQKNINFYRMDETTIEVETPLIDAYGQKVYCFIEKLSDGYRVSDDGWILYKLDPLQSDQDFFEAAIDVALGSGFDFDEEDGEIFQEAEQEEIAMLVNNLAQLQVAISFLK